MLNDVPVLGDLVVADAEYLADDNGRGSGRRGEADVEEDHIALSNAADDLPLWLRGFSDEVSEKVDGGLRGSARALSALCSTKSGVAYCAKASLGLRSVSARL